MSPRLFPNIHPVIDGLAFVAAATDIVELQYDLVCSYGGNIGTYPAQAGHVMNMEIQAEWSIDGVTGCTHVPWRQCERRAAGIA